MIALVGATGRLVLTLELDRESEPISGRLDDGAGHQRPFHGWLELTSMLSAAAKEGGSERAAAGVPREPRR
jgi:hypothetical protein